MALAWAYSARQAHCVAGEPGTGKSQLTMAIVATLTMGGQWPCNEGKAPLGSAEDGAADTIVPRLHAAGADLGRVQIVSAVRERDGKGRRAFSLQVDLALEFGKDRQSQECRGARCFRANRRDGRTSARGHFVGDALFQIWGRRDDQSPPQVYRLYRIRGCSKDCPCSYRGRRKRHMPKTTWLRLP